MDEEQEHQDYLKKITTTFVKNGNPQIPPFRLQVSDAAEPDDSKITESGKVLLTNLAQKFGFLFTASRMGQVTDMAMEQYQAAAGKQKNSTTSADILWGVYGPQVGRIFVCSSSDDIKYYIISILTEIFSHNTQAWHKLRLEMKKRNRRTLPKSMHKDEIYELVDKLSRDGLNKLRDIVVSALSYDIFLDENAFQTVSTINDVRNAFVHQDGIVTGKRAKRLGLKDGHKISLSFAESLYYVVVVYGRMLVVEDHVSRHFRLPRIHEPNDDPYMVMIKNDFRDIGRV